ncbi:MAG: hypothetical protein DWQ01_03730 [Planctomycetota bacterium]|nr:MAG: hypothetical protein DWQ01_03730 [Planctomycetota bacterium]
MLAPRKAVFLPVLLLAACPRTRVEVSTEIGLQGEGRRTVLVETQDEGKETAHPEIFRIARQGYGIVEEREGVTRSQGFFQNLAKAPPAFHFQDEALSRQSAHQAQFARQDWVLFTRCLYQERIQDVVDMDDIKAALDEFSQTALELASATFANLLGPGFEDTQLQSRMRGDLKDMLRELSFSLWRSLQDPALSDKPEVIVARALRIAGNAGFRYRTEWFVDLLENGLESQGLVEVRRETARWLTGALQPKKKEGRRLVLPDLEVLMFEGAFQAAYQEQMVKRFGSAEGAEQWWQRTQARIFGLFGNNPDDITFVFRVKMPGQLLRSTGYLGRDGWTFLEFPAADVYPNGKGIHCESVIWSSSAYSALLEGRKPMDNETALDWTLMLGEGPDSKPHAGLVKVLQQCVQAYSLSPLQDAAEEKDGEGNSTPQASKAQGILDWLNQP